MSIRRAVVVARSEAAPFAVVVGVALVLRLVDVASKPFHHDESEHAWFSWLLVSGRGYHYDPVFHGPVQYYLTGLSYLALGVGDFAARFAPALAGAAVTGLPYFLRRRIGYSAALGASVLFCISPSYLYFSRFAREDIYTACVTLALIVAIFAFFARPRRWHPALILGLLAVSFATKETTYITVAVIGSFFAVAVAWQGWRAGSLREAPLVAAARSVGYDAWLSGGATFLLVYTVLFTTFFTNPHGLQDGLIESIRYWLSQHPVNRGGHPPFYYLVVLPAYEWPALLLAIVGALTILRRPTLFGFFLLWAFVVSLGIYSAAGERMPWLTLHPLLPLILLAGIGVQALWLRRRSLAGAAGLAGAVAAAVWSIWIGTSLSFGHPADAKEMLVFTQTSSDVPGIRDRIVALDRHVLSWRGRHPEFEVDGFGGTGWPWGWYLRDLPVAYPDMSDSEFRPTGEVVVVSDLNRARVAPFLRGYRAHRFRLRVWWVVDYGGGSPREWVRWLAGRETWGPLGRLDAWLYVKKGLARST